MPPVGKIAQLPPELRDWLHAAFVERAFGSIELITEELNAKMKEGGVAITIGKSAVGAASQRYRRMTESLLAVTKQMQAATEAAGDSSARRSEALNALVSTELFEALVDAQQAEAAADPVDRVALLNKAALAVARLSSASVQQQEFRQAVEAKARAAADAVSKLTRKGGLSAASQAQIRNFILGIAAPGPAPAAEPAPETPAA